MLSLYGQNQTSNWKQKDCVVYLVISLSTKKAGGSSVSTDLVNVESFFTSVIVPELQSSDVNALLMLKADALKFFTTFRNQISKPVVLALIPDVVRYLGSESNVVHSYAVNCIEKLLLVKDEGRPRYTSSDISPFLPILMTNLFNALKFPESQENFYVMNPENTHNALHDIKIFLRFWKRIWDLVLLGHTIPTPLGYMAKFVHLYNAGKKEEDPLKEVRDPKEFLLNTLAKVSATAPGKYPAIIKGTVDPANQSALLQLCSAYNCSIVLKKCVNFYLGTTSDTSNFLLGSLCTVSRSQIHTKFKTRGFGEVLV